MPYIGNTPAEKYAAFDVQYFTTSATASYTLDHAVANELDIRLVINNVIQEPGSGKAYTATGTTLTLSAATAGTDTMYCVYTAKASQTVNPPAGSVGPSQIANNAVDLTSKVTGTLPTANGGTGSTSTTFVNNTNTNSTLITSQTAKTSLVDADKFLISDSAASGALKYVEKQHLGASNPTLVSRLENNSDATSLSIQNCFSATYDVYKVVFYIATTQAVGDLYLKFLKNTSDDFTGTDLNGNMFGEIGTTSPTHFDNGGVASSTFLKLASSDIYNGASSGITGEILIAYPFLRSNNRIHINYHGTADGSSGVTTYVGGYVYSGSEIATGLKFYSGSGPTRLRMAEINVYGYNK